jgi:4-hydroxy-tetrahydrodipicolinate synthase
VSEALARQGKLNPLMDALFSEQFPEAVRRAFAMLGLPVGRSLAPIGTLSDQAEARLQTAVDDLLAAGSLRAVHG